MLLDLGLPDTDGFASPRELRGRSDVPIIVVTAKSEEIDRVVGLELGADDYIVKPFGFRELARPHPSRHAPDARAPGRRAARASARSSSTFAADARVVEGRELDLTPKEFDLLALLAREPGAVVSRSEILAGGVAPALVRAREDDRRPRRRLRKKLGDPAWIETVRGVGLRLHVPERLAVAMSRRLLASYVTLTIVVLAALEIPLGIQYGRSEQRDLDEWDQDRRPCDGHARRGPSRARPEDAAGQLLRVARKYAGSPGGRTVVVDKGDVDPRHGRRPRSVAASVEAGVRGRASAVHWATRRGSRRGRVTPTRSARI